MTAKTNGEKLAERFRGLRDAGTWARQHPDELAVFAAPYLAALYVATKHRLPFPEHMLICELGAIGGAAALAEYQRWKAQPAPTATRLRGVSNHGRG